MWLARAFLRPLLVVSVFSLWSSPNVVVRADLPVHCLPPVVRGQWELSLGPTSPKRQDCGHQHPDSEDSQPRFDWQVIQKARISLFKAGQATLHEIKVTVDDSNTKSTSFLNSQGSGSGEGGGESQLISAEPDQAAKWTMVYDEGFDFISKGLSFAAFFLFKKNPGTAMAIGDESKDAQSICDRTQVGWYRDSQTGLFGCFIGKKIAAEQGGNTEGALLISAPPPPPSSSLPISDDILPDTALISNQRVVRRHEAGSTDPTGKGGAGVGADSLPPAPAPWGSLPVSPDAPLSMEQLEKAAESVNRRPSTQTWRASAYPSFVGMSLREVNRRAGLRRGPRWVEGPLQEQFAGALKKPSLSLLASSNANLQDTFSDPLPASWDWRNVKGKNFVPDPMDQGDCGSCYLVSTIQMLTARKRILLDDPKAEAFSTRFPLACSEYNQGCKGGYPYLAAKWIHEVGLVPERCGSYSPDDSSCSLQCDPKSISEKWTVGSYSYTGGFYGATNEENLMREVKNNGPVTVAMEPDTDFMLYASGVYKSVPIKHAEWEKVDHAVLLVGWGETTASELSASDMGGILDGFTAPFSSDSSEADKKAKEEKKKDVIKYWIVQNSWGAGWGEGGFFRIQRGQNELGIEAEGVGATLKKEAGSASEFGQVQEGLVLTTQQSGWTGDNAGSFDLEYLSTVRRQSENEGEGLVAEGVSDILGGQVKASAGGGGSDSVGLDPASVVAGSLEGSGT
uniref:Dipeptidyl peptidase 1 n=1 Tax=Chromera velia CCMP2878 TaxID=1169474 RepID=A0A0G4HIF3_9ALVE